VVYADGRPVRLGDVVTLGEGRTGEVVCAIDDDAYAEGFSKADWGYLARGALIQFQAYGLIHYRQAEPDLVLVVRAGGRQR
jgi:hypothetical protein